MPNPQASRVGRRGHSPAFRASVVAAIVSGGHVRDVAALYGVSKASVWLWCKLAGVRKVHTDHSMPPTCHPGSPHYGRGLCRLCYRSEYERNGHVVGPRRKAA